jgi:SOS-response transcriptional repressor LexA
MAQLNLIAENNKNNSHEQILIDNVRELLKIHKMNEAELARQANVPKPTLHKILAGSTEDPRISTLQAIANVFKITVDDLYSPSFTKATRHKIEVQAIPVISWTECLKGVSFIAGLTATNWKKWLITENTKKSLYGLVSKSSMESQFPIGTVFIIDPEGIPRDGDLVVVEYPDAEEATLREMAIDGPIKLLLPISNYAEKEKLTDNIQLLGTVVQSRLDIDY